MATAAAAQQPVSLPEHPREATNPPPSPDKLSRQKKRPSSHATCLSFPPVIARKLISTERSTSAARAAHRLGRTFQLRGACFVVPSRDTPTDFPGDSTPSARRAAGLEVKSFLYEKDSPERGGWWKMLPAFLQEAMATKYRVQTHQNGITEPPLSPLLWTLDRLT